MKAKKEIHRSLVVDSDIIPAAYIDDWCGPGPGAGGGARVFISSSHSHVRLPPPPVLNEHDTWVPRQTEPHVSVGVRVPGSVGRTWWTSGGPMRAAKAKWVTPVSDVI